MLWTKRAHQCTIFRLLGALMKVHPIPHAIFETTRSGFIQILHHCSVSWKITPLYFFSSNLLSGWLKIYQIPYVIFETKGQFFFKLCIFKIYLSMSWEISHLYFFRWNFIWFLQKEHTTVQNLRLLTAQVKFRQICTW